MKAQYQKLLKILKRGNAAFVSVRGTGVALDRVRIVTPHTCRWFSNRCDYGDYRYFLPSCFTRWLGRPSPEAIVQAMSEHDYGNGLEIEHVQELK